METTQEKSLQTIRLNMINSIGHCQICLLDYKPILQLHHITPVSLGGEDTKKNLVLLCPNCHKTIHSLDSEFSTKYLEDGYVDSWMDNNISRDKKKLFIDYAVEILKGRYQNAGI